MLRKVLLIVLLITLLAACSPQVVPTTAPALTFTDGLGREVTLEGIPQRIVSIAPSNTEILFAIGAGGPGGGAR